MVDLYRQPLLFEYFLSMDSLIHISKLVKNDNFLAKNGLFICEFRIRGPKWRNVSIVNNEGNLYYNRVASKKAWTKKSPWKIKDVLGLIFYCLVIFQSVGQSQRHHFFWNYFSRTIFELLFNYNFYELHIDISEILALCLGVPLNSYIE